MLELALVHNGAARFVAMSAPAANPATASPATEVRQPVMTDNSPTGPLRLFRPRAAAQFAWLLPLALAGLVLAWSDASGPGAPVSRRISAGVWTGWLVMYWIVLSFAGGLIHTYYVAVLGPPLAVFSGIAVAGLWSRWKAGKPGRIYLPLIIVATAAWQFYLCMAPSEDDRIRLAQPDMADVDRDRRDLRRPSFMHCRSRAADSQNCSRSLPSARCSLRRS